MYYNQKNYPNILYPGPTRRNATAADGACGVCAMSMVLEEIIPDFHFPIEEAVPYAIKRAYGDDIGGTNMNFLSKGVKEDFGVEFVQTNEMSDLVEHLKKGLPAIALVGGNHDDYIGVFTAGGHFITVKGLLPDGRLIIWDPSKVPGKYDIEGRKGKVELGPNDEVYCTQQVLADDTDICNTRYWLYFPPKKA